MNSVGYVWSIPLVVYLTILEHFSFVIRMSKLTWEIVPTSSVHLFLMSIKRQLHYIIWIVLLSHFSGFYCVFIGQGLVSPLLREDMDSGNVHLAGELKPWLVKFTCKYSAWCVCVCVCVCNVWCICQGGMSKLSKLLGVRLVNSTSFQPLADFWSPDELSNVPA